MVVYESLRGGADFVDGKISAQFSEQWLPNTSPFRRGRRFVRVLSVNAVKRGASGDNGGAACRCVSLYLVVWTCSLCSA
jgi:hypothetical protein